MAGYRLVHVGVGDRTTPIGPAETATFAVTGSNGNCVIIDVAGYYEPTTAVQGTPGPNGDTGDTGAKGDCNT